MKILANASGYHLKVCLTCRLFWEFSGRDKNTVQARRASECIVEYQEMHLLAPRACILGVFIKQLGLSGIQATEVALSNLPIEATKTREEPTCKTDSPLGFSGSNKTSLSKFGILKACGL